MVRINDLHDMMASAVYRGHEAINQTNTMNIVKATYMYLYHNNPLLKYPEQKGQSIITD